MASRRLSSLSPGVLESLDVLMVNVPPPVAAAGLAHGEASAENATRTTASAGEAKRRRGVDMGFILSGRRRSRIVRSCAAPPPGAKSQPVDQFQGVVAGAAAHVQRAVRMGVAVWPVSRLEKPCQSASRWARISSGLNLRL